MIDMGKIVKLLVNGVFFCRREQCRKLLSPGSQVVRTTGALRYGRNIRGGIEKGTMKSHHYYCLDCAKILNII